MQTREEKTKAVGPKLLLVFTVDFDKGLLYQNSQKSVHLAAMLILEDGDGETKWRFSRICKRERKNKSWRAKASPCFISLWMWSVMMITYLRRFLGARCTLMLTQLAAHSTSGDRRHPSWRGTRTALNIARTMRPPDSVTEFLNLYPPTHPHESARVPCQLFGLKIGFRIWIRWNTWRLDGRLT